MYDLLVAPPHVDADARYSAAEWAIYVAGYTTALVMAGKVLEAGVQRWRLYLRTRNLETRRRRQEQP